MADSVFSRLKKRLYGEEESPNYLDPIREKVAAQETAENAEYMQSRGKSSKVKKYNENADRTGNEGILGFSSEAVAPSRSETKRKITSRRISFGR